MNIALAQINCIIGDFEGNYQKIKEYTQKAEQQGADIIVFPELSVCGYPPRDFLEFNDFIERCQNVIERLTQLTENIAIIVGSPSVNPVVEGKDLFNSAYFLAEKKVMGIVHKALLPTYDIFDEYRYFEPGTEFNIIEYKGERIALTVCEDIWNIGNENPLYKTCPMDVLTKQNPSLMINISASPFNFKKAEERIEIVKDNVERYGIPLFYCNYIGGQTEILFDGGSIVMNKNQVVVDEMPHFEEELKVFDTTTLDDTTEDNIIKSSKIERIHDALVLGVKDYFGKLGFTKAILGLSGGIDSAVTLAIAARALGAENVLSVLMPSEFSSDHSVNDSVQMCKNLNSPYKTISIKAIYDTFLNELEPHFENKPFDVTEENIQARSRGVILMALSNKHGHILLNTSNKSEAAVGYGTLYGDMAGGLSIIGDVYKTDVYALARYINKDEEIIPEHIITKPPSAELRHNQKDSDSLPDYDILDDILELYIEGRLGPKDIIAKGYEKPLVERILRLVNRSEYKRYQTPPMLRVSPKAFGMGRRMPLVGKYLEQQ